MFICFTGIDGSGKSTLARRLVAKLESNGKKSQYVYSRFRPQLIRPLAAAGRSLFLRNKNIYKDYSEYSGTRKSLFRNRFLSMVYERLLLFDYCMQTVMKVKRPLIRGVNVVCDRYVYDTVITDLAADMGYSQGKIARELKRCFWVLPKPDIVFLIDTPEDIAFSRKNDVPSVDYLRDRRMIYLQAGKEHNMIILDGAKDLDSLMMEIWAKVEGRGGL